MYERIGWFYASIGYCNSPLNNKNTNYHYPMFFSVLGFHANHCVNCGIVVVSCGSRFFCLSINFSMFMISLPKMRKFIMSIDQQMENVFPRNLFTNIINSIEVVVGMICFKTPTKRTVYNSYCRITTIPQLT